MKDSNFLFCCKIWENYIDCKKKDIKRIEEKIKNSNDSEEINALTHLVSILKESLPQNERLLEKAYEVGKFEFEP